jgi:hypothetical protein
VDRSERKLFTPIQIGPLKREHRLVMAPLTRSRSKPGAVMRQYYTQRNAPNALSLPFRRDLSASYSNRHSGSRRSLSSLRMHI